MVGHSLLFKWVLWHIFHCSFSVVLVCSQVLHCCVNGSSTYTQQSHYLLSLADLSSSDYDPFLPLGNVTSSEPAQCHSVTDLGNLLTVAEGKRIYSDEDQHVYMQQLGNKSFQVTSLPCKCAYLTACSNYSLKFLINLFILWTAVASVRESVADDAL